MHSPEPHVLLPRRRTKPRESNYYFPNPKMLPTYNNGEAQIMPHAE